MKIGEREVGRGRPCFIIGEVGLSHEGSLGMAMAYVDAIAEAGADCAKFQMHIAEAESTPQEPFRLPEMFPQDASRYDYWKRTAFRYEEWERLKAHTESKGLVFLCSPFSVEAIDRLERLGVEAYKVPSGMVAARSYLERLAKTGKPVIVSTGMSTLVEIVEAGVLLGPCPIAYLQCTSEYPCQPERWGLNCLEQADGFSDHSGTIAAGLAAVALGASILEVHVCFSKRQWGPDGAASLTMEQFAELVRGVGQIDMAFLNPVDKDKLAQLLSPMRRMFMPSLQEDGTWKKSGMGALV